MTLHYAHLLVRELAHSLALASVCEHARLNNSFWWALIIGAATSAKASPTATPAKASTSPSTTITAPKASTPAAATHGRAHDATMLGTLRAAAGLNYARYCDNQKSTSNIGPLLFRISFMRARRALKGFAVHPGVTRVCSAGLLQCFTCRVMRCASIPQQPVTFHFVCLAGARVKLSPASAAWLL
jgi:hypothetical protein